MWVCSTKLKKLKCVWDMNFAGDLVLCLVDVNGHIGRHIDGFDLVHGGYFCWSEGFGRMNVIRVLS